jgi:hypothetical protein
MKFKMLAVAAAALSLGLGSSAMAAPAWMQNAEMPPLPGCAKLMWNMFGTGHDLSGIIWFADGTGFGSMVGQSDQKTGEFKLHITPVMGSSAPSGTVTGMVKGGDVHAVIDGGKCANMKVMFKQGAMSATPE